jgi:hypothetical protein
MTSRRAIGVIALVAISVSGSIAFANPKQKECKPSGVPNAIGQTGAVEVAQPVDYWSKPWLLVTDKQSRPDKVRLVSATGEVIEIGKPPITVDPVQWLARGRAVYALGRGRSQIQGKTDVTLMRWGTDPRPRLTILRTVDALEGQLSAAFENEFLAVSWAEKGKDGKLHRMVSFMDSEDLRVPEPKDLGVDAGAAARVQPVTKGFVILWTSAAGLMRAPFDQWGKPAGAVSTQAVSGSGKAIAVLQCADRAWLMRESGSELALASAAGSGALSELAKLPSAEGQQLLAFQCVNDSVVVGRRTFDAKAGNITFWVSTIDQNGKVHDRRVKDTKGTLDDIRMPQFSQIGAKLTSWWIEGHGVEAKVWSREISCE